jgi:hypothetical protein
MPTECQAFLQVSAMLRRLGTWLREEGRAAPKHVRVIAVAGLAAFIIGIAGPWDGTIHVGGPLNIPGQFRITFAGAELWKWYALDQPRWLLIMPAWLAVAGAGAALMVLASLFAWRSRSRLARGFEPVFPDRT